MNIPGGRTISSSNPSKISSSSSNQYFSPKRNQNGQSISSPNDLRELSSHLQELNVQFKKNLRILTEIKDHIVKVCEKQETRPVEENSDVNKLERVRFI